MRDFKVFNNPVFFLNIYLAKGACSGTMKNRITESVIIYLLRAK